MAYAPNDLITATGLDTITDMLRAYWGLGDNQWGLGQDASDIPDVSPGDVETAAQINGILSALNLSLAHQGQALVTPASVAVGDPIRSLVDVATATNLVYANSGTTGLPLLAGSNQVTSMSTPWGARGNKTLTITQVINFSSADAARHFFNAGGTITVTPVRTGTAASARDTSWSNVCSAFGSATFAFHEYWTATTSLETIKSQSASSPYTDNVLTVQAKISGATVRGGEPTIIITTTWANMSTADALDVTGTCGSTLVVNYPSTAAISDTWGTPTVAGSWLAGGALISTYCEGYEEFIPRWHRWYNH